MYLGESGSASQVESVLGSLCMATQDVDRQVAMYARRSWTVTALAMSETGGYSEEVQPSMRDKPAQLNETSFSLLLNFVRRALFDPQRVYLDLNPVQPASTPSSTPGTQTPTRAGIQRSGGRRGIASPGPPPLATTVDEDDVQSRARSKADEDEENEDDRKGRLRVGALGALKWALGENLLVEISVHTKSIGQNKTERKASQSCYLLCSPPPSIGPVFTMVLTPHSVEHRRPTPMKCSLPVVWEMVSRLCGRLGGVSC